MRTSPDEDYNYDVFETLKKIRREFLSALRDQPVDFKLSTVIGVGVVDYRSETKILRQLEEWKAIKFATIDSNGGGWEFPGNWVKLWLIEPKFSEIYKDFSLRVQVVGSNIDPDSMSKNSQQVLISDLEYKYHDVLNEKSINKFYLKLSDYGKYLNENEVANPVLLGLYQDSQKQISDLKKHWSDFFNLWKKHAKSLIYKADEVGIKDEGPLQDELERLRECVSHPDPQFSDTELPKYWYPYREIIRRFVKANMIDRINIEHLDSEGNLKLYPEYQKVEIAWNKYKQNREISIWWAHYQVSRLAAGVTGTEEEKGHYFKDDNDIDQLYKFEFDKISRGEAEMLIFLRKDKFEEWIRRLHKHLIPRLKELTKHDNIQPETRYEELLKEIRVATEMKNRELEEKYSKLITDITLNNRPELDDAITESKSELDNKLPDEANSHAHKFTYTVSYESGDILINNKLISNPNFDGENDLVFSYLFSNPNKKFTRMQIETSVKPKPKKTFNKIIENLGFTKDLRKLFFNVSKKSIKFNNPVITSHELKLD